MKREKLYTQIILETLSLLYENSEPKLDFMNFINTTNQYVDKDTNEPILLEEHISVTEMRERGLVIDVPFEKHFIDRELSEQILQEQINKYKLNKSEQERFKTQIYLGSAPAFKH
jgi:threonyl-tRNA synthetase